MKHYVKFEHGTQCKNAVQKAAYELFEKQDGILLPDDKSKDDLIWNLKSEISKINIKHHRCGDITIDAWGDDFINLSIASGIAYIRIYPVKNEL